MTNTRRKTWSDFWKENQDSESSNGDFRFIWACASILVALSFVVLLATGEKAGFHEDNTVLANSSVVVGLVATFTLALYTCIRFGTMLARALGPFLKYQDGLREAEETLPNLRRHRAWLMDELALAIRDTPDFPNDLPLPLPANAGKYSALLEDGRIPSSLETQIQAYVEVCLAVDETEDCLGIPRTSIKRSVSWIPPKKEDNTFIMSLDQSPAPAEDIRAVAALQP